MQGFAGQLFITHGLQYLRQCINRALLREMKPRQSLVVWAINEGRGAARECDRYLMGATTLP